MAKMHLGVIYGGRSGEHEVSLQSATSVVRNTDGERFTLTLIGITRDGRWFLQPDSVAEAVRSGEAIENIERDENREIQCRPGAGLAVNGAVLPLDCVFPVLHGTFGEDGTVQGLLELVGLPYVGTGVLGSALGMDKELAKRVWLSHDLPVVPFHRVSAVEYRERGAASLQAEIAELFGDPPYFVKPACTGSSVGITKVHSPEELDAALQAAFRHNTKALIEPGITAREIEISVLGNHRPQSFTPGEVIPTHEFYDYEAKYIDPNGAELVIPAGLPAETLAEARRLALAAYRACDASGFARVDLFYDLERQRLLLNEINTIPGFTRISMFPRMCAHDGLSYPQLLAELVDLAVERHSEQRQLNGAWSLR